MTASFPTLIVSRRPREIGSSWNDARSWFGGQPQLGRQPWPRGGARKAPLYFLAQIDLADVQKAVGQRKTPAPLPDGALAFFVGSDEDRVVVHVPRSELGQPTAVPSDALAVFEPGGAVFPATFDEAAPRLLPRWPVDITAIDIEPVVESDAEDREEKEQEAMLAAIERHFTRTRNVLSAKAAYQLLGDAPRPSWWHTAHYYLEFLRTAVRRVPVRAGVQQQFLDAARAKLERLRLAGAPSAMAKSPELTKAEDEVARNEAKLAEIERAAVDFEQFVRDVTDWVRGTDPWHPMPPNAVARLASSFERGRTVFREFTSGGPYSLADVETETLLAFATADDRAYATLPEVVRNLINDQYLLPSGFWHQMFGKASTSIGCFKA